MGRVKIELPAAWSYAVDIPTRITDINYGHHVGNDSLLAILHDARFRWLHQFGWTELDIDGVGLIMVDVSIRFRAEAGFADLLRVQLAPGAWTDLGFDLIYQVVKQPGGEEVARAQSSFVFFDYKTRKLSPRKEGFRERVESARAP